MSQRLISQVIEKTCDVCGAVKTYEMVGPSNDTVKDMQEWYTGMREVCIDGQWNKIGIQCYGLECYAASGIKLVLPPQQEETEIDLASLRQQDPSNLN